MIPFLIGTFIGGIIGFFTAACLAAASKADDDHDAIFNAEIKSRGVNLYD